MTMASAADKPVTRADIEAKLAEIRGVADDTTEVAEGAAKTGLVVAGVGVVIVAFLLGRRRGRKKSTIVEVRRI
jgi:MYXO-CTERM domain-containing protein